jgi:hypothetical protein
VVTSVPVDVTIGFTVSVAGLLLMLVTGLVTMTRKEAPLSLETVAGVV